MPGINPQPNLAQTPPQRSVHFSPFTKMFNNLALGLSKASDNTTDAFGSLYPKNFNTSANLGTNQSYLNTEWGVLDAGKGFDYIGNLLANAATKYSVCENFFGRYRNFKTANIIEGLKHKVSLTSLAATFTGQVMGFVALDSSRFVLCYYDGTNRNIVVGTVDSAGAVTFGSPTTFGTTNTTTAQFGIVKINTDKIAMVYQGNRAAGTGGTYLTVATFVSNAITLGTESASMSTTNNSNYVDIIQNGTDKFQVAYMVSDVSTRACTVSGTTITLGAALVVNSTGVNRWGMVLVSTDKIFFNYTKSSPQLSGVIVSVSTTTSTNNTEVSISTSATTGSKNCYLISASRVLVFTTSGNYFYFCDISGTTITVTPATVQGANVSTLGNVANLNQSTDWAFIYEVSAGATYDLYLGVNGSTQQPQAMQITISSNIVSIVSGKDMCPLYISTNNSWTLSYDPIEVSNYITIGIVGTKALSFYKHLSTLMYSSCDTSATFDAYNDAVSIGSYTHTFPFAAQRFAVSAAINNKKAYFGIKNTTGASKSFMVDNLICDVE